MKNLEIFSASVPSSINSIGKVVDEFITKLQCSYGAVNECILFELRVILNEVLINAIRHGNREDVNKIVKVDAGISGRGMIFIIVEDEGCGYDFDQVCNCRDSLFDITDLQDMNECGRGIKIVRSLCDHVKVNAKGNKIILAKNLTGV